MGDQFKRESLRLRCSWSQDLGSTVSSICLSWDQKRVLASCGPVRLGLIYLIQYSSHKQVLQLWSIDPQFRFIRKFTDHQNHGRFIIQSGFAAVKDRFVMSGSEGMSRNNGLIKAA